MGIKVAATTLGCKVNLYDTEWILNEFKKAGYEIQDFEEKADVYIVNTCTVTGVGDKKSRQLLRRCRKLNPEAVVVAYGCYAQVQPEVLRVEEGVSLVVGAKERERLVSLVEAHLNTIKGVESSISEVVSETHIFGENRTRAYIKIEDGCDRFCSYCIIPYARGPVRSRPVNEILNEFRQASLFHKEIVLVGIHLASYGKDLGMELIDLLEQINALNTETRLRLGSLDPCVVTEDFVRRLSRLSICPHFHLSLQSGSETILKAMGRRYTKEEYRTSVGLLRTAFPDVSITTDVIAGFPGESDDEFQESYDFIESLHLSKLHVFPYAKKAGTKAAMLSNHHPASVKNKRAQALIALSKKLEHEFLESYVNKSLSVLFETYKDGFCEGYSQNYISLRVKTPETCTGKIASVQGKYVSDGILYGEALN